MFGNSNSRDFSNFRGGTHRRSDYEQPNNYRSSGKRQDERNNDQQGDYRGPTRYSSQQREHLDYVQQNRSGDLHQRGDHYDSRSSDQYNRLNRSPVLRTNNGGNSGSRPNNQYSHLNRSPSRGRNDHGSRGSPSDDQHYRPNHSPPSRRNDRGYNGPRPNDQYGRPNRSPPRPRNDGGYHNSRPNDQYGSSYRSPPQRRNDGAYLGSRPNDQYVRSDRSPSRRRNNGGNYDSRTNDQYSRPNRSPSRSRNNEYYNSRDTQPRPPLVQRNFDLDQPYRNNYDRVNNLPKESRQYYDAINNIPQGYNPNGPLPTLPAPTHPATVRFQQNKKEKERAPREYEPAEENVKEVMEKLNGQLENVDLGNDQEVEIINSNINVRLNSFDDAVIDNRVKINLEKMGHIVPRPIQTLMIPQIMGGNDVIGQAETGGGKTAAFGIPIIEYVLRLPTKKRKEAKRNCAPFALILTPTRELTFQIFNTLQAYAMNTDVTISYIFGEIDTGPLRNKLQAGCEVLVACCGRTIHFLERAYISLSELYFLVLDEADRQLKNSVDLVTGEENPNHLSLILARPDFKRSLKTCQKIITSATFNPGIEDLAKSLLKPVDGQTDPVRIRSVGGRLNNRIDLEFYETPGLPGKFNKLRQLLYADVAAKKIEKTIVFIEKKSTCVTVAAWCCQTPPMKAMFVNSDLSQDKREEIYTEFKENKYNILVGTDVISRGLDILDLERVIQFDLPSENSVDAINTFIQRCGRTGRVTNGKALVFIDTKKQADIDMIPELISLVEEQGKGDTIPDWMREAIQPKPDGDEAVVTKYSYRYVEGKTFAVVEANNADQSALTDSISNDAVSKSVATEVSGNLKEKKDPDSSLSEQDEISESVEMLSGCASSRPESSISFELYDVSENLQSLRIVEITDENEPESDV